MEIVNKKLEELKPYENNPRVNEDAIEYVAKSIQEFGFKVPIVIDKDGVIVTGHTRYKASQYLGLKEVPCIIADDLSKKQIKAFRLADNKVADFSYFDNTKLLEELEGLDDIFTGFEISEGFEDVLDEGDTSILGEEETIYKLIIKSVDKTDIDKVRQFCEDNNIGYE